MCIIHCSQYVGHLDPVGQFKQIYVRSSWLIHLFAFHRFEMFWTWCALVVIRVGLSDLD